ncbi:MAG: aminodeoxychorismate synthase component [Nevskia sp.]|nr:aminodeoxychorismate synthase component [Nevskia sp.]
MNAAAEAPLHRIEIPGRPDFLALHRRHPQRYPFLLESAAGHALAGRYDILFAFPQVALEVPPVQADCLSFFDVLSRAFAHERIAVVDDLPFCGGWFLLLGYEAARGAEPRLRLPPSPYRLPDALAVRCTGAAIYDRQYDRTVLIAERDSAQLRVLVDDCAAPLPPIAEAVGALLDGIVEEPAERFLAGVERILEYLLAGDTFQVNLSRRWQGSLRPGYDYVDLYKNLRRANPAPFAGLARWGDAAVLSSSPERLLAIDDGLAQTRPIAGTHARRADAEQDRQQRERLIASLKERAEHIMLIDLERNDLGRICVPGSIEVSELMAIESYAHVHHIVSNVRGRLRAGVGPGEALRAVFPGGTITGCPKVRAMEIIGELESSGRGPYTGAMGYLSRCGRLDTNILIRTLVCEGAAVSFRAGAGIVADSDPAAELAETRAKARGLLLAMGLAP